MEEESLKYIYLQHAGASQRGLVSSLPGGGRRGAPRALFPRGAGAAPPFLPGLNSGAAVLVLFYLFFFRKSQVGWKGERWCCSDSAPPEVVWGFQEGHRSAAPGVLTQLLIA